MHIIVRTNVNVDDGALLEDTHMYTCTGLNLKSMPRNRKEENSKYYKLKDEHMFNVFAP